jgi:cell wall-associated NlpC family hydrolase
MKNALKNLSVVIVIILTLNVTVMALPNGLQPQKDSQEEIESKIERFDNEIEKNMAKTKENKLKISQTQKAIVTSALEIKQVEKQSLKEEKLFNSRMRTMYMNGFDGYTSVILSSESVSDLISRVDGVKTIIEYNEKVVTGFKEIKNKLNEKQKTLSDTKKMLLNLQIENKQKLDKIILTKKAQKKLITQLNVEKNFVKIGTSRSQLLSANTTKSLAKYTPSRGSASSSEIAIISFANQFVGTPYIWGGTSPSTGFDCSGFTQYVYSHFGVAVGRSTFDQINAGTSVSKDNLKPGDLVLFGSNSNPQHAGIYVGNNSYIHSPRTGESIKISPMTRSDYMSGRRLK